MVDTRDHKVYKTIVIGNQTWMAENLAWLPSLDYFGIADRSDPYTKTYHVYRNNDDVKAASQDKSIVKESETYLKYGVLYNFAAAKTACPSGWHLPTDKEWQQLELFLGIDPEEINHINVMRNSGDVGKKLKSPTGWDLEEINEDAIGFNALPAGERGGEFYTGLGISAEFWVNNVNESLRSGALRMMSSLDDGIYRGFKHLNNAVSVRCVKNN